MSEEASEAAKAGPSKNELKKLAKKAEKAAKKQQQKQQGGGAPPAAAAAAAAPVSTSSSPTSQPAPTASSHSPSSWSIIFPDANSAATIKTVWAAQAFGVDLKKASSATAMENKSVLLKPQQAALLLLSGNDDNICVTGTGGNAMAQAVALSSSSSDKNNNTTTSSQQSNFMEQCWVDEWCEWERTVLRHSSDNNHEQALAHLEQSLHQTGSTPCHLVGTRLSVADICVATTLLLQQQQTTSTGKLPPAVQLFCNAHQAHFQSAVEQAKALQEEQVVAASSSIDMTEPSLQTVVDEVFRAVVADLFGTDIELPKHIVKPCSNPKHGDFQLSVAMPIFAAVKKQQTTGQPQYKGPPDVANAIVAAIGNDHPVLTDLKVQGPGFVLCKLHPQFLQHHVNAFLQTGKLAMPRQHLSNPQTCVVDFSSPNIAKEMHVGHLRSTIIGEAVCRILEAAGHQVHRVNHVGDWGTQFGMLIQYLKEEYPDVCAHMHNHEKVELPNITDLTGFYKNAKQRFDEDEEFKKQSQLNVVDLQSGDPECLQIWKMLCDVSRKEFEKVYTRLDIQCEEYGESFYNERIPPVIEEFVQAGKIQIEEGGAKCVWNDKFKIPLMLQKSDGGFGYDSTDMAALRYRLFDLRADRIIVITDFSQGDHFKMIYAAGHDIGWVDRGQRLDHIGFGTVQGEDGKRFKTRSGDTVRLVDLLDEAVQRMEDTLRERMGSGQSNITETEVHEVSEAIGYGAVKYYDLRRNPTSNYKFSYDEMLNTKGDTAVYLLYARVRLESIMAKAAAEYGVVVDELLQKGANIAITDASERNLALQLMLFTDAMEQTLEDLFPYHICEYVYKLAMAASDFVTQCRVLGSPEMESRLLLCHATVLAMHQCFDLLGIRHVKRI